MTAEVALRPVLNDTGRPDIKLPRAAEHTPYMVRALADQGDEPE